MNVSIVIPAWNAGATLAETLDSLLAQTFREWEAVVVDDGSTDGTSDVTAAYSAREPRIRLIRQTNAGEAGARNTGLAAATHGWLLFLDADDWIAPEYLARMTHALALDPGLDAVHCDYARVAGDGTRVVDDYVPPTGDMFRTWARRSAFPVHCCVVRASLAREVGGFDTTLEKSADWDFWQKIARTGASFGRAAEVLAFYRMTPNAASHDAPRMLRDGLTVLARGHAPDPRVMNPNPDHACGLPPDQLHTQAWYLLSWCAGLMIGRGEDARSLFDLCHAAPFPELYAPAVAQSIFDAAPLPLGAAQEVWPVLWHQNHHQARAFLKALELATGSPDLAPRAEEALTRLIIDASSAFTSLSATLHRLETERDDLRGSQDSIRQESGRFMAETQAATQKLAEMERERADRLDELTEEHRRARDAQEEAARLAGELAIEKRERCLLVDALALAREEKTLLSEQVAGKEAEIQRLNDTRRRLEADRDAALQSPERQVGDFLLNRAHLRRPLALATEADSSVRQRLELARLRVDRSREPKRRRILATACWNFPIHSQTFVYQELTELMKRDFELRLVYSRQESRSDLHDRFAALWPVKTRLYLNKAGHERDFHHYRRTARGRVDSLVERLALASGLAEQDIVSRGNFLQAFTFTRMAEAYRPHYIHSYFFYDRSLMALVAAYLLDIPRGISCYSDHVLDDYELKVVPLHMELCDLVVATSERIRGELMALAPHVDHDKILVKPNGIDVERFPLLPRREPEDGEPFRVITVARIEPKKGLLDLVEAIHLLRDRGLRVEAHIIGVADDWSQESVEYKHRLDRRITELGLWGTVHLEGRRNLDGILRFHGMSHLFVAPFVETKSGDKDGIPTALLEGMSTGLPVVATDAGSITEVVENGREGLIVPQRDPAAMADAIEELLRDGSERARSGNRAASLVRSQFDASACESAFHQRVTALIGGDGRSG